MPGPATPSLGNISLEFVIGITITPASVANATTAEQTFTAVGVRVGDYVSVSKPTLQAGLFIANTRVSANNVIAIAFGNVTAATITPTAGEVYTIDVCRFENYALAGALPSGLMG